MGTEDQEGHRERLRQKFLKSGLKGFHDYEIVELLLTLGTPRRDCKQPAKKAIEKFKSLRGVLAAPPEELQEIKGIRPTHIFIIKFMQELGEQFLKEQILDKEFVHSSQEVSNYLRHSMRDLKKETFKVMFLTAQNQVIAVEDLFEGTLTVSAVYPREIIKSAIKHNAAALIFAHNHPAGDPAPSDNDKQITRDLVFAGNLMQMKVLDHIIIGDNRYFSFADEGLIEKYDMDFLSIRRNKDV